MNNRHPQRLLPASGGEDQTVRLWDPVTGASVAEPFTGHTDGVRSVAFGTTADGRLLLASDGEAVRLWDPVTGAPMSEPLTSGPGHSVAFGTTADGRLLLASDARVWLWDPVTGTPTAEPLTIKESFVDSV